MTYMLEGSSRHEDSAGHKGTIVAGGVQWMCAVSLSPKLLEKRSDRFDTGKRK